MIDIDKLKKISENPWFYPLVLLLMGFVAYGYVLTSLGYYWADWEIVMFTKLNPSLQFGYYAEDRPFPWTYELIYFLVGSHPIGWHIVTLFIRWTGTLFFVNSLILLWPRYKKHILWLGALLIVYPGFLQQSQSATKARHIMTFLLFALSIYLMILAIKRPKWRRFLFSLSWTAAFLHLFTTEYFSGLELMRPVLLWILIADSNKNNSYLIRRVAFNYLPYLLITLFFFWCRFVYFPEIFGTTSRLGNINSTTSGFQESFVGSFLDLFNRALLDLIYVTLQVWINALTNLAGFSFQRIATWFAFGVGILLTAAFSFFYDVDVNEDVMDKASPIWVFIVGLFSFVLSALPVWAIGKEVSTGGWNDRFALAPMLGACLMVMALILWFVRPAGQKYVYGFLLVFSIATQVWAVNIYRRDWSTQLDYYWQLHWRVPALQSGTAVFSFEQPSAFVTQDTDAGYAVNVLYHYQTENGSLPYWFITPESETYFGPDNDFRRRVRNLEFNGNTSEVISIMHQTGDSCLRALDEVYLYDPLYTQGQDLLIPMSNLSRIIPDPDLVPPDKDIFGPEPAHNWCYFFQKADLARQINDWDKALALYDQAQQSGFAPKFGAEYIPFIEAYAQTGDWQMAYDLTIAADELTLGLKRMLCANWVRLGRIPASNMKMVERVDQLFSC
jgi:hypothetical protein